MNESSSTLSGTSPQIAHRSPTEWISSLPACLMLLLVVIFTTSSDIHNQILRIGQSTWDGYYELRSDPVAPTCSVDRDIDAEVDRIVAERAIDDADDLVLFEAEPVDPEVIRASVVNSVEACQFKHERYEATKDRITPGVRAFRSVELFIGDLIAFGLTSQRFILAFLVVICAATATFRRHHISMRPMESRLDHRVSSILQFAANCMLLLSAWSFRDLVHGNNANVAMAKEIIHLTWIIGFAVLVVISGIQIFRIPADAEPGGNFGHAMLSVPLYTTMCLISGTYFLLGGHAAGVGIYLDKMMDLSDMFLNVGLYVWIGMMLKETKLAALVFNVFHPWKMPPELLAVVAIGVAAIPTAYTGASGIFVIAAGSVIYLELRKAGARRQLALAATAMSGSLGVVLRPCLLVVIIAYLNREVTTDQLFGEGVKVFFLTLVLFALASLTLNRQSKLSIESPRKAFPAMMRNLKPIIPYALLVVGTVYFYALVLDVQLDEFSAPRILPVMMLAILVYEHFTVARRERREMAAAHPAGLSSYEERNKPGFERSLRWATNETTVHIGALLFLMGLSVSIGGVIERSHLMDMFPTDFASPWTVMLLLVGILVIIGMVMDPYGAVILVSVTISNVAYQNGIDPIHFWMVTLVAFELGYLSPPVALNHLLTRQVVGEAEVRLASQEGHTFYQRHERILMPLVVMGTALIIVAFGPLVFDYY
ncbi:TRAP transporter large permease subunit [Allohahella marinimesophila]|uniref:TRAP transporter large permease subunit n=1 Tax=Allohahella marinimesophila TaxID=1054972 RepID=A0ABP7PE65_9GAMM